MQWNLGFTGLEVKKPLTQAQVISRQGSQNLAGVCWEEKVREGRARKGKIPFPLPSLGGKGKKVRAKDMGSILFLAIFSVGFTYLQNFSWFLSN